MSYYVISRIYFRNCLIDNSFFSSLLSSDILAICKKKKKVPYFFKALKSLISLKLLVRGHLVLKIQLCLICWLDVKYSVHLLQFELITLISLFEKADWQYGSEGFLVQRSVLTAVLDIGFCSPCMLFIHESLSSLLPSDTMCLRLHFMNANPCSWLLNDLGFTSASCVLKNTSCCLV